MPVLIDHRRRLLEHRLDHMRKRGESAPFQTFVLGLLPHDGYDDVRPSHRQGDFGRDGVGRTPDGKPCVIAVSFECSLAKIRSDARRWREDPNREPADVLLFVTAEAPLNTVVSPWVEAIRAELGLELRIYNREAILQASSRQGVWQQARDELGVLLGSPGYVRIAPYDTDAVRKALRARPPEWLRERIELPEWERLMTLRSRLLFGKPGAGKTTTLFEMLERTRPVNVLVVQPDLRDSTQIDALLADILDDTVIVFDDLHESQEAFTQLCVALRAWPRGSFTFWAATRSQEWEEIRGRVPKTVLEDLDLFGAGSVSLSNLDERGCRRLIEICRDEWGLLIESRLLHQAAEAAAARDATPLFVISMLAAARTRDDLTLRDEHLAGLPRSVRDLWARYWQELSPTAQTVLRLIRLFWAAGVPPETSLLDAGANAFGVSLPFLSSDLSFLERALWISRPAGVPQCLDVQLEVVSLEPRWLDRWDSFVHEGSSGATHASRLQLHIGSLAFYYEYVLPRAASASDYDSRLLAAARHGEAVAKLAEFGTDRFLAALALNNSSVLLASRSSRETTREGRVSWLDKATAAVEESVAIYRELGVRGDLASSLNNASNRYSDRAALETTREGRVSWLDKATAAVEESVAIRRELGVRGDLAMSLGSLCLRRLGTAEIDSERDAHHLEQARHAIDEALPIFREVGQSRYLLLALQHSVIVRLQQAEIETTSVDPDGHMQLISEGLQLAISLRDDAATEFFRRLSGPPTD